MLFQILLYSVLCDQLGDVNDLETATKQILTEYGIQETKFLPQVIFYTGFVDSFRTCGIRASSNASAYSF